MKAHQSTSTFLFHRSLGRSGNKIPQRFSLRMHAIHCPRVLARGGGGIEQNKRLPGVIISRSATPCLARANGTLAGLPQNGVHCPGYHDDCPPPLTMPFSFCFHRTSNPLQSSPIHNLSGRPVALSCTPPTPPSTPVPFTAYRAPARSPARSSPTIFIGVVLQPLLALVLLKNKKA